MKKTCKTLLALSVAALMTLSVSAFEPIGDVAAAALTPTIDGTVKADEWAGATKTVLNGSNMASWSGEIAEDFSVDLYTAWDDTNLYVAGVVTDSTLTPSATGDYGGDAFQISLSVGQLVDANTKGAFYSFGFSDGGTNDVVVQECPAGGSISQAVKNTTGDNGWSFEVALPWARLASDAKDLSGSDFTAAAGAKVDALFCYLDRDGGTLISAHMASNDGAADSWNSEAAGITLILGEKAAAPAPADPTPAPETTPAAPSEGAAQTADLASAGILASVLALGAAAVLSKKR